MEIQNIVNELNEQSKIESGKEYNLGQFINDLKKYKDEFLEVEFDNGYIPTEFDSWRGNYCELALGYEEKGQGIVIHSNGLYKKAYNANNSIFTGYKGGDFVMDLQTPIHQANYGEVGVEIGVDYDEYKIIGLKKKGSKLIILTRKEG